MTQKTSSTAIPSGFAFAGSTQSSKHTKAELDYSLDFEYDSRYAHRQTRAGNRYYRYDGNGNLLAEKDGPFADNDTETWHRFFYDEKNDMYGSDYGFALEKSDAPKFTGGSQTETTTGYRRNYTWNERNMLTSSEDKAYTVKYRYGDDNQRALKVSSLGETLYFNNFYQRSTTPADPNSEQGMRESKHIFVGTTRLVTKISSSKDSGLSQEVRKIYYYHADHLGSAQLITDYKGREYECLEYTPYGEVWIEKTAQGYEKLPFRFTGKELDEETGLYYYGARYLDPKYSRWLSTDPAMGEYVPQAPINDEARKHNENLPGMGGLYNLVNMHVYHYAGNNPIKYTDPTGMWKNNGDGTFTAEKGDTLWGLQQETGVDWRSSNYQGKPENLQIGQNVSFAKANDADDLTIDHTNDAISHYFNGNGESVNLGEKTIDVLKKSPEHKYNQSALANGTAKSETHRYDVDMKKSFRTFHIGKTNVTYEKYEGSKYRLIIFSAFVDDGFWDPIKDSDGAGPKGELPGGTVYKYNPYSWTEVYEIYK